MPPRQANQREDTQDLREKKKPIVDPTEVSKYKKNHFHAVQGECEYKVERRDSLGQAAKEYTQQLMETKAAKQKVTICVETQANTRILIKTEQIQENAVRRESNLSRQADNSEASELVVFGTSTFAPDCQMDKVVDQSEQFDNDYGFKQDLNNSRQPKRLAPSFGDDFFFREKEAKDDSQKEDESRDRKAAFSVTSYSELPKTSQPPSASPPSIPKEQDE